MSLSVSLGNLTKTIGYLSYPFALIHSYVWGLCHIPNVQEFKYFLVLLMIALKSHSYFCQNKGSSTSCI